MMKVTIILFRLLLIVFAMNVNGQQSSHMKREASCVFPLQIDHQEKRHLVDQTNRSFFWLGDAAWSLIAQLSNEDVDYYLDNREAKGFSVTLVNLIEKKYGTKAPSNYYGELPFKANNLATPNMAYFDHADSVIESAAKRNILVLLSPLYLGYGQHTDGWFADVQASSPNDLYIYGKFLGSRYKKFSNILWIIGGDTDPSPVKEKVREMVRGIRENDSIHLFTAHNEPEMMAITPWQGEPWLTVNNVYSYDSILYTHFKTAYEIKPLMPWFLVETAYENEHNSTPKDLRAQAYEALLSGAMGHIFGNCPVWNFGSGFKSFCNLTDWKTELNNSGSQSMYYFQRLFRSRSWHTLIPDFDRSSIISGVGRWGSKEYVTTARTIDGNTIIAYLPSGRKIKPDLSKILGERAKCWWFDPSNGNTTLIGTFRTTGNQSFTPPSKSDWVLVIDNEAEHLPGPGKQQ